jgi:hypothetical protein
MKKLVVASVSIAAVLFAAGNSFAAEPDKPGSPAIKTDTTPKPATDVKPDAGKKPADTPVAKTDKPSAVVKTDKPEAGAKTDKADAKVVATPDPKKTAVAAAKPTPKKKMKVKRYRKRYHARHRHHRRHHARYHRPMGWFCPDMWFSGVGDFFGQPHRRHHVRGHRHRHMHAQARGHKHR